jgi:hypothetical protein
LRYSGEVYVFGEEGQDSGEVSEASEAPVENSQQEAPAEPQSDGHPAWAPLKEELGDFAYHKATKYLKEFDDAANKRITEVNSKYEPWKQFADQGVTPDQVGQAFASLQRIQQDPVAFYNQLAEHLRSQGMIQEAAQAQAQADDAEDDWDESDPRDKQIAELREQNERILAFQEQQWQEAEQARLNEQASVSLQKELNDLQNSTNLAQEDLKVVLQRAHLYARADVQKSLREVYDEVSQERNTLLTRPRPNDSAPRLPGVGGSAPTGNPAKKPEEFSRQESQNYLADLLRKENQAS